MPPRKRLGARAFGPTRTVLGRGLAQNKGCAFPDAWAWAWAGPTRPRLALALGPAQHITKILIQ
jgi:hypothetical protein